MLPTFIPHYPYIHNPSLHLLNQFAQVNPVSRALFLGCSILAPAMIERIPSLSALLVEIDYSSQKKSGNLLQTLDGQRYHIINPAESLENYSEKCDLVLMSLPKGRKLAQRWLIQAHTALRQGGTLYLAGSKELGIQSVLKDANQIFDDASIIGYKKGHRIASLVKPASRSSKDYPAWWKEPGVSPDTWFQLSVHSRGRNYHLHTLPGVFAYDHLDDGSAFLLEHLEVDNQATVLDIGCGYGILGITAALEAAAWVDLIDNNLLAVACTQENISTHSLNNARSFPSDALKDIPSRRYSQVVTNPPFHVSKAVDYDVAHDFITQAVDFLEPGGSLWLVANRFIRYDHILEKTYRRVNKFAENNRYHIWVAWNN
jgi:16S rRNA (guanine1207-N2)-methyltransferase